MCLDESQRNHTPTLFEGVSSNVTSAAKLFIAMLIFTMADFYHEHPNRFKPDSFRRFFVGFVGCQSRCNIQH